MSPLRIESKKRSRIEKRKIHEAKTRNEINPFELRHNKIKHQIVGRKIAKNEFGKPLINRNRAFKKREQTLLKEYRNQHKCGKGLEDLRENEDQRISKKYRNELNQIDLSLGNKFNLTHRNRPLDDLLDERPSDDENDDLFSRNDYVDSHFRGGDFQNHRTQNDILNEIIAEKRRLKEEKNESILLTEKLDDNWNQVRNYLHQNRSTETTDVNDLDRSNFDDYDKLLNQLKVDNHDQLKDVHIVNSTTKILNENNVEKSSDSSFKTKLESISKMNDIAKVIKTIKELIDLLSKINKNSILQLRDKLISLTETKLLFTPYDMAILIVSVYFKELHRLIYLIILKSMNKIKYSNLNEVACSIYLNNFLLQTMPSDRLFPELFIHLDNLFGLCLPREKVSLHSFHRLECESDCHLNVEKIAANIDSVKIKEADNYRTSLTNLFNDIFKQNDSTSTTVYNLAFQIFRLLSTACEKYSSLSNFRFFITPLIDKISILLQTDRLPKKFKSYLTNLLSKLEQKQSISRETDSDQNCHLINANRPKPFILPLLEPRFEMSNLHSLKPKQTERKKLLKKFKREFKGAQREIRKDSTFLREVYLKDVQRKDQTRKRKVKEILGDLAIQQGLYKKKSK
ncbi:Transcription initiation factor TFIID subunit 8 [Sarcoptes scabiei]|uniref:Nucleolar protein 14 n=1 Tax=Sarcoptes scabiei TaxID=52283 RepID=A0A131ZX03_SARSC|nr:Transcription initiation factor TFIID subunit 8 [Sarcoptes scabiei]KPM03201.1 nucleolar protein 14-like protein [Sarcoptes scabiei]